MRVHNDGGRRVEEDLWERVVVHNGIVYALLVINLRVYSMSKFYTGV